MALAVGRPRCLREVNRPALGSGSWKDPVRHFNWANLLSFLSCPEPASCSMGLAQRNASEGNFTLVSVAEGSGIVYFSRQRQL